MNNVEILKEIIQEDVRRLDIESKKHKNLHRNCQKIIIILTASASIVAGAGLILPESSGKALQFSVLCLTTLSAGVTSYTEMRRARELWQHEREVYYALVDIQREIRFNEAYEELSRNDVERYFQKASEILGSSTLKWSRIQEKKNV